MNDISSFIKVPGKLMIAGEYAVLNGGSCVVVAVSRYVEAKITPSNKNILSIPKLTKENINWVYNEKHGIDYDYDDSKFLFLKKAMELTLKYIEEKGHIMRPFHLHISSDLNDHRSNKKYGLGSSAAIVVAVTTSILNFFKELANTDPIIIFKLSAMAHFITQGKGSCADIAACVYGGWLHYKTFDPIWLLKNKDLNIQELVKEPWPNLVIEAIKPPKDLNLLVGWTNESVGTVPMVDKIMEYKKHSLKQYKEFMIKSNEATTALIRAFSEQNLENAMEALSKNRKALIKLGRDAKVNIETSKLRIMCDIADKYGKGKSSGAGGGDCGIAFSLESNKSQIINEWELAQIVALDLKVSSSGYMVIDIQD